MLPYLIYVSDYVKDLMTAVIERRQKYGSHSEAKEARAKEVSDIPPSIASQHRDRFGPEFTKASVIDMHYK